ncbi:MAG: hypothetical protein HQ530_01765 [Parcubacteria group bacterium]|nr:hypothetical protein [Parcubacteria group bacterium]
MTLRNYLIGMMISTIFCWASWIMILIYVDPESTGVVGLSAFYVSLFFAMIGTLTLLGFYLRVWFSHNEILFAHVGPSFRQAIFLSLVLVGSLTLQSFRLLTWWDGALFIAAVALLEFYFISRQSVAKR